VVGGQATMCKPCQSSEFANAVGFRFRRVRRHRREKGLYGSAAIGTPREPGATGACAYELWPMRTAHWHWRFETVGTTDPPDVAFDRVHSRSPHITWRLASCWDSERGTHRHATRWMAYVCNKYAVLACPAPKRQDQAERTGAVSCVLCHATRCQHTSSFRGCRFIHETVDTSASTRRVPVPAR
jgi:hypothetical protein